MGDYGSTVRPPLQRTWTPSRRDHSSSAFVSFQVERNWRRHYGCGDPWPLNSARTRPPKFTGPMAVSWRLTHVVQNSLSYFDWMQAIKNQVNQCLGKKKIIHGMGWAQRGTKPPSDILLLRLCLHEKKLLRGSGWPSFPRQVVMSCNETLASIYWRNVWIVGAPRPPGTTFSHTNRALLCTKEKCAFTRVSIFWNAANCSCQYTTHVFFQFWVFKNIVTPGGLRQEGREKTGAGRKCHGKMAAVLGRWNSRPTLRARNLLLCARAERTSYKHGFHAKWCSNTYSQTSGNRRGWAKVFWLILFGGTVPVFAVYSRLWEAPQRRKLRVHCEGVGRFFR